MNYQHLDRTQVLKRLQTFKEYKGWTQTRLSKHLGNHVSKFRKELDRLENQFYYFLALPDEIQAVILSYDRRILKRSMCICKAMALSPPLISMVYHEFCHSKLGGSEIYRYFHFHKPDFVMVYKKDHFNCMFKNDMNNCNNNNNTSYGNKYIYLDNYGNRTMMRSGTGFCQTIDLQHYVTFDVINIFHMFKNRNGETLKPGYNQAKTKDTLKQFYDTIQDTYRSLLVMFLYLKINLALFHLKPYKNTYRYFIVDESKENNLYGPDKQTVHELTFQLKHQCDDMFQQLNQCIDTLK